MQIVYLIIGLIVGAVAAFFIAKFKYQSDRGKIEERNSFLQNELDETETELNNEREKVIKLNSELSGTKADYSNLQKKLLENKEEIEQLQEKFIKEFENLSSKILEEKSSKFTIQNKENLEQILNPLNEKIKEFERKVEESNKDSIDRNAALRQQLLTLKEMNQQMSEDAKNLVKALKGDTKTQGDWGELQLEKILERSGLRRGQEYSVQETITSDSGSRSRPDVIINLPEEKKIIVDSKVSLVHYERFVSAEDEEEKNIHLRAFIDSVKKHIKDLSQKSYQSLFDEGTLDFVLMFIPIEPAFSLAIQYGENLYVDAYDKNIIIVSPSTLLATLRTISNIWKQEYQNRNVVEIANQSGALYDKFVGFVDDLVSIGNSINSAKDSYEKAMNKLVEGRGNLVSRTEKIKKLGAKATKTLPQSILNRAEVDEEDLDNLLE